MNERIDAIIRLPHRNDLHSIPVGIVSKDYTLIPHSEDLGAVVDALREAKIPEADQDAELILTEYGERMAFSVFLPERYSFDPGDGHPMGLRLECVNSVEGSTRFRVIVGWLRLVCSNGLVIGVTRADIRRRHVGEFSPKDVVAVLADGLREFEIERRSLEQWRDSQITDNTLKRWVNGKLKDTWGFKAATRAYRIAMTGHDAKITEGFKDRTPTTIATYRLGPVPGSPPCSRSLFDVSQILAWLARGRRDMQEQLEWREEIPALMKALQEAW